MIELLQKQPLARARDLKAAGIDAPTIARAVRAGVIVRAGRGLYQLPGIELDAQSALAEASKRVPRGVICMISGKTWWELC